MKFESTMIVKGARQDHVIFWEYRFPDSDGLSFYRSLSPFPTPEIRTPTRSAPRRASTTSVFMMKPLAGALIDLGTLSVSTTRHLNH